MKFLFSESSIDYNNYKFGYSVNLILNDNNSIENVYSQGFLPYTGDIQNKDEVYYLARSIRVDLNDYERLSENNRIVKNAKKKYNIKFESIDKSDFNHNEEFYKFCIGFSKERFSNKPLNKERLSLIIRRKNYNRIYIFSIKNKIIGYVLAYENSNIIHYWFSFYDTRYLTEFPLGKFMMEHLVYHAKKIGKKYIFLGTCYGEKALYKVRDFKGIEFYNGNKWIKDNKILKAICKSDPIK